MTGSPGKPIPYEAPPPPRNLKEKIVAATRKFHLNYYMVTSLYMMEPMERAIINCIIILILTLLLYSSFVYLPHYTWKLLVFTRVLSPPEGSSKLFEDPEAIFIGKSEL